MSATNIYQIALNSPLNNNLTHFEFVDFVLANDVLEVNDVFVLESGEHLDLPQSPLTVGLVLKWHHLLDGHFHARDGVNGGDDHTVRALAQEFQGVIARTNLQYAL